MKLDDKIFVAGHRGLVGSALTRNLKAKGHTALCVRSRNELDLRDRAAVQAFFTEEKPQFVFLAAAKVGGILANNAYPADFIRDNLEIQTNVIDAAYQHGVERLLFLGSSCIYPKMAPQPLQETSLLTGPLEPTNRAYALAKIAGIEMCWSYNRQFGTRFLAAMPTNLYGPGDNYDLANSHVIPALIRKFHEAKKNGKSTVVVWGSGKPKREFLYSDDMADACIHLMNLPAERFDPLIKDPENSEMPPVINLGVGHDLTILELSQLVSEVIGFNGNIVLDQEKPDGTPRKLMDVSRLTKSGWSYRTPLKEGITSAYEDFLSQTEAPTLNL